MKKNKPNNDLNDQMKKTILIILFLCLFICSGSVFADGETPAPETEAISSEALEAPTAGSVLLGMTLEQKITQMIFPALRTWGPKDHEVDTTALNDELHEIFGDYSFGGVTLFGANITDAEQTVRLIHDLQKTSLDGGAPAKLMITIDQEGGYITRLKTGTQMPGNMALGASGDPENARKSAQVIGRELTAQGISVDFAPVVDVNNNPTGKLPVNIPEIGPDHRYAETTAYERGFGLLYN